MGYEIFTRKVIRTSIPSVSISKYGRIGFNGTAAAILQENAVENVLLLWDKGALRFAVRPITKKDSRAYKVHYGPRAGAAVNARTFLRYIAYDHSETRSFKADWNVDEEMFEVDLPADSFQEKSSMRMSQ